MIYKIKNWTKFQHYNHRKPPWIKLYRDILDDIDWFTLPEEARGYLVMLWLIASDDDGVLPPLRQLSFRLRISEQKTKSLLSTLSNWLEHDDSEVLATSEHDATPEKSRVETEKILSDFDAIWQKYPRRDGRKAALNHFRATVLNDEYYSLIQKALDNYLAYIKKNRVEPQFIKTGATWFNNWFDWVDQVIPGEKHPASQEAWDKRQKELDAIAERERKRMEAARNAKEPKTANV